MPPWGFHFKCGFKSRFALDDMYMLFSASTILTCLSYGRLCFFTAPRYPVFSWNMMDYDGAGGGDGGGQTAMLVLLWTLKSFGRTALFFPSVIGLLIIVRLFALPKMFTSQVFCVCTRRYDFFTCKISIYYTCTLIATYFTFFF